MSPGLNDISYPFAPYCGAPPTPDALFQRWNFDPFLIGGLLAVLALYAALRPVDGADRGRARLFYLGWCIGSAALISPLCALSVALFSARVGQHMLLATVVAPLIAAARPLESVVRRWPRLKGPGTLQAKHAWVAALTFAGALWFWHAPLPYVATFRWDTAYWLMHVTTFAAALWLWSALLGSRRRMIDNASALAITSLQMGVLGAVITFAPRPLYAPHLLTAWAWGVSPLVDQQLGGAIMWVPAGVILAMAAVAPLALLLRDPTIRPRTV